jgi:hypothetical protein
MRCHYANAKRWNALTRRLGLLRLHALHELTRVRGREPDRVRAPRLSAAGLALLRLWSRKIERIGLIADVAVIAASVVPSLRVPSEEARECTGRVGVVVFPFALHADVYRHESRPSSLHLDLSVPAAEDHARAVIDALVRRVAPNAVFDVGRRGASRGRGHRGGRRAMRFNATNYPVRHGSGLSRRAFVRLSRKSPLRDFTSICRFLRLPVRLAIRNFRAAPAAVDFESHLDTRRKARRRRTTRGGARTVRRAGSRCARTSSGRRLAGVRYPGSSAFEPPRGIGASLGYTSAGSRRRRVPSQIRAAAASNVPRRTSCPAVDVSRGREGRRLRHATRRV